jgi:hypothetical protein
MKQLKAIRDNFVRCHRQRLKRKQGRLPTIRNCLCSTINSSSCSRTSKEILVLPPTLLLQKKTENDAEGSQDTLDQTANSTAEDSKSFIDTTASPTTGNDVSLSPSKRKRKNLHKHGSKRAANEQSIASSDKELTSILTESLAIQKEQAYQEKERQADVYGNQAFLMSFVPALNSMPLHVAIEARLKIAVVFNASLQRSFMNLSTSTGHNSTSAGCSTSGCSTPTPSTTFSTESNSEDFNITDYIPLQSAVQNN